MLLCAAALLASSAQAATLHVPSEYPTIQAGLAAASNGDTVLIACGIYFESELVLPAGITLAGAGDAPCAVIDGGQHGPILTMPYGVPGAVVRNLAFRDGSAPRGGAIKASGGRIESCRFDNNYASDSGGAIYGGGLQLLDCEFVGNSTSSSGGAASLGGSPFVRGCTFRNNTSVHHGGALRVDDGYVLNCLFQGNEAGGFGGGLSVDIQGTVLVQFCTFVMNSSARDGGGVSTNTCSASFLNCWFEGNTAERNGGGLYVYNSDIPTESCVFIENHADQMGGGYAGDSAGNGQSSTLRNCTFWGNSALSGGGVAGAGNGFPSFVACIITSSTQGGAFAWQAMDREPYLACCDLWGNVGGDWMGLIADLAQILGNFSGDPLFCAPGLGNFTIRADSPCAPPGITDCGLVGALPVGCGTVSVDSKTWGAIKGMYR